MAQAYSSEYRSTLSQLGAPEAPFILMEINHAELASPIRVVNDNQSITSNGNLYVGYPFNFVMPSDYENQLPKAKISIDNVGRELMQWIETSNGAGGATVKFSQIMRSRPNQIEWEISMSLFNVQVNQREISAELGFENLFAKPAISIQYRPENSAPLF